MEAISLNKEFLDNLESEELTVKKEHLIGLEGSFEEFCSIYTKMIKTKLAYFLDRYEVYLEDKKSFESYSYRYLYKAILNYSLKTLIKEINKYKDRYNSENDVYCDFSNDLMKLSFHKELYEKYPELYLLIKKRIENYFSLIGTFLNRLIKDFKILQNTFKLSHIKIADIYISNGDFHNGGSTTVFFSIDGKNIVYKPKNLENDLLLQDIVGFINEHSVQKCKLKHVETINKGNYGWQIVIEKRQCEQVEEVNNFYYRIGSFLSIFMLLGTEDLHNENILSSGEHPYFIDLETLVKPVKDTSVFSGVTKSFFDEINQSVLSTMLLPTNAIYSAVDCDIGGISSFNEGPTSQIKAFQLINKGTDRIELLEQEVFMGSGENHLYLNDRLIYPTDFSEKIIEGFTDTFSILKENIDSLYELIKKRNVFSRCVLRPTFIYGLFLDASIHPNYLHKDDERFKLFHLLFSTKHQKANLYVEQEIKALMNGDVPYFHQDGKDLVCNQEYVIKDYFDLHLDEIIAERINRVSTINIERQVSYIRLSLSTLKTPQSVKMANIFKGKDIPNTGKLSYSLKKRYILDIIEREISKKLLWDKSNESCTWLTVTQFDSRYRLNCANGFIYESGGVLMFYLMLFKHTNESKYLSYAESIFRGLREMGMLKQKLNESAFVGATSHLYLASNLYQITKKEEYKLFVIDTLNCILDIKFNNIDYLNGVSGLLVLLNSLYKKIPLKEILTVTKKAVHYLENNIENFQPETGIAHGYSGLALGYIAAAELLNDNSFLKDACNIVSLENEYFDEEFKNWLDLRDNKSVNYGWCRGSSGIAVVRAKLKCALGQNENTDLNFSLETTYKALKTLKFVDDSLCHGLYGAIDNLIDVNKILGNSPLDNNLLQLFDENLDKTISSGFKYGAPTLIESDNLFVGSIGLGYLILRSENNKLPSILHLELF